MNSEGYGKIGGHKDSVDQDTWSRLMRYQVLSPEHCLLIQMDILSRAHMTGILERTGVLAVIC